MTNDYVERDFVFALEHLFLLLSSGFFFLVAVLQRLIVHSIFPLFKQRVHGEKGDSENERRARARPRPREREKEEEKRKRKCLSGTNRTSTTASGTTAAPTTTVVVVVIIIVVARALASLLFNREELFLLLNDTMYRSNYTNATGTHNDRYADQSRRSLSASSFDRGNEHNGSFLASAQEIVIVLSRARSLLTER